MSEKMMFDATAVAAALQDDEFMAALNAQGWIGGGGLELLLLSEVLEALRSVAVGLELVLPPAVLPAAEAVLVSVAGEPLWGESPRVRAFRREVALGELTWAVERAVESSEWRV